MQPHSPLIVTLRLDDVSFLFFDALRQRYFPPEITHLSAHLTLFHHLPSMEKCICEDLENWSEIQSLLPLNVTEIKSLGKGVAYKIECPQLLQLHRQMQVKWKHWLTPQDQQKLWPHITVQNKVSVSEAQETWQLLRAAFQPFTATGVGFDLWSYEGGPWRFLQHFSFCR